MPSEIYFPITATARLVGIPDVPGMEGRHAFHLWLGKCLLGTLYRDPQALHLYTLNQAGELHNFPSMTALLEWLGNHRMEETEKPYA